MRQRFGSFEIDLQSGELRKNGLRLRLSGQPFQILAILIERAGQVVTREELQSKLWPAETFVDFDHGLNNGVARIREVLEDSSSSPRYVETLPRRGYRFVATLTPILPVTEVSSPPEPLAHAEVIGTADPERPPNLSPARNFAFSRPKILISGAVLLAAIAALVIYYGFRTGAKWEGIHSLAVLPLRNFSGEQSQEYLADGMTEELIGRLAGIHELRVISRTSIMRFKDSPLSAQEIAKTLRVDALLEGSIKRQGGRIRIHAQLIRADTDAHIWSETYDRDMSDVLAAESQVAQAVAEKVRATVTGEEHTRLVAARRVSPDVYENYLKGQFARNNTRAELEKSASYFEAAIREDPTFAPAYLGLANAYQDLSLVMVGAPPGEARRKAVEAVKKALELDPSLAEAHVLLADIYQKRWQWSEAETECKQALRLAPNDASAHMAYARLIMCRGQTEEAISWARRARELDPMAGSSINLIWVLFQGRHYDEAIREARSQLAVHPDSVTARFYLSFVFIANKQPEAAIPELQEMLRLSDRSAGAVEMLACAYASAGRRTEALALIDELKQRREKGYVQAGSFINPYLMLRQYDDAFSFFEQAYAEQSNIMQFLKIHPFFDPVRADPRFQSLLQREGLR